MSSFTPKTLSFLRSLKRNNQREWFHARKDQFEAHCRAPMIEIVERLAVDMRAFAPELVADPKVSLFRQFRDTRFSEDKTPPRLHEAGWATRGPADPGATRIRQGTPGGAVLDAQAVHGVS